MNRMPTGFVASGLAILVLLTGCGPSTSSGASAPDDVDATAGWADVAQSLSRLIEHEVRDKDLPSVTIALVDDQEIVWARGFGFADLADSTPATAATVHRVGSVSKLFTDIAIMQLVERGELDLDEPVTTWLPDFAPADTSAAPITLRHLMAHRSGLMREPPDGNYFDPDGASLEETVRSLNGRPLIYAPGTRTKYSNAAIALVGHVLETRMGQPFATALREAVLEPMGLTDSAFEPSPELVPRLAGARMWTWDGRTFGAPTFQLGMAPAGSMYSTVLDLGRFLSILFNDGRTPDGNVVLEPGTLERMWTPQFAEPGSSSGFGIGFAIGERNGYRRIGHGGAIYGFATELAALPERRLGVVVVSTLDVTNSVVERIADHALLAMVAAKDGAPLPGIRLPGPVAPDLAARLAGSYASPVTNRSIELVVRPQGLYLESGGRYALRTLADTLVVDDRLAFGGRLLPLADGRIVSGRDTLVRAPAPRPAPVPAGWAGLIGEYGWDHNTLYIFERAGSLHALIEWFFEYPLEEVSENVFRFPDTGLYAGESLIFARDDAGRATAVETAGVTFRRRAVGTAEGETFRITPRRPVDELREAALAAQPPAESGSFLTPDLVDLRSLDPTIRYDIRYATANNFMGAVFYDESLAFLQRPAAEALVRAHRRLNEQGYGLLIHDAYRPWYVTKMFWDATPEHMKQFVADPDNGSRHNRGAAVDLTLFDIATGRPVTMVSGYDEFSDRAYPEYRGETGLARWHRELLREAMEAEGFQVYEWEWWHFDFDDWRRYPIGNVTFDQIR